MSIHSSAKDTPSYADVESSVESKPIKESSSISWAQNLNSLNTSHSSTLSQRKLALIPARSGSKRIPHKNIKDFCGKPIISYSICTALESKLFNEVIVSTDSEQIADIARSYGANVPFLRPKALSDDFTSTAKVAKHAITKLNLDDNDLLCVIYPTAPLLKTESIARTLEILLADSNKLFAFCAVAYDYNPYRSFLLSSGSPEMLFPAHYTMRSQDLCPVFHDAGQLYWGRAYAWRKELPIFARHSGAIILNEHEVQDIDTPEDWLMAEMKYTLQSAHKTI